jgi:DNA polymerase I
MNVLKMEHILIPVVVKMELTGVKIDLKLLKQTQVRLEQLKLQYAEQITGFSKDEININSNAQLSTLLFETLAIIPKDETIGKNGSYKVDKTHLLKLIDEHEIISLLLKYRRVMSLLKDCNQLSKIHPKTGRLHASFNQIGTETGRFSSNKPNLQNVTNVKAEDGEQDELKLLASQFRKVFIPKRGYKFICADYSQIELRVMAEFSQDPFLIKAYTEDIDIHMLTASQIFGIKLSKVTREQRNVAKSINFGLIYGETAYGLAPTLTQITGKHHTVEQAQRIIDDYFGKFKGVKKCLEKLIDQADERGYSTTLFGRKRPILQLQSSKLSIRQAGKRIAMNSPIQGTAADIIKMAMIKCDEAITDNNLKSKMILQVHDELLFEVPNDEMEQMKTLVKETMENAVKLTIPIGVELQTGTNWAMAH